MADNTTTQSGTLATVPAGEVFGFDDVGGVKIARSKTGFGTDGSYTDVSASDPLPVTAASLPLPSGAATSAKQDTLIGHVDGLEGLLTTIDADTGAIATAAATLAGAVAGTEVQADIVAALPAGTNNIGDVDVATTVLPTPSTSATVPAQVADTTTSTTLIAAGGTHKGFRIVNTSSFSRRLPQYADLEENHYRGRVDGIWTSDPGDGVAAITLID